MFGTLTIGLLVTAVVAVSLVPNQKEGRLGLAIIEVSENRLEGEYRGSLGSIRFIVTSREGNHSLAISNIEGEPIITSNKPGDASMMTMTMGNTKFLAIMNEPSSDLPKYSDYVVPTALHGHVEAALSNSHVSKVLIQHLDSRNSDMARKEAVENLVSRGEADLIEKAAKALGNAGVMGTDSSAAQKFYVLAMRLETIKDFVRLQSQAESSSYHPIPHSFTPNMYSRHPQKRASCRKCITGECPYYGDQSRGCHGMCGRQCTCWWWMCGDCCVHRGCLEHDDCCQHYGYVSFECLNIFAFSCSGYSC